MVNLFRLWFVVPSRIFRTRRGLLLENLALRQQLAALKRQHPKPKLDLLDKLFWVAARRLWSDWKRWLYLVAPETVAGCHRAGFRRYWALLCKRRKPVGGVKRISNELRQLIFQRVAENAIWGAPRIHGEFRMLGFEISERTISRWMRRTPRNPESGQRRRAFLRNHREALAAVDFFTVPTLAFNLYCFFVISHDRRRIVHFNITRHPTSNWIVQQLREAFPYQSAPRFLPFDHDQEYGLEVLAAIRSINMECVQTSIHSPWQNGVAERRVGSCRRDLLDHVIALNETHLKRLLGDYIRYYHDDRAHLGLSEETPGGRVRVAAKGRVVAHARLGGLHQRYDRAA